MNIFLFRLSNLISTISIGFIITLNSVMFFKKYDRYEYRVENLISNINGELEFISNKEILQHIVYSILVLLILIITLTNIAYDAKIMEYTETFFKDYKSTVYLKTGTVILDPVWAPFTNTIIILHDF